MPYSQRSELDSVLAMARNQHGNLDLGQLRAAGLGKAAIAYRCRQRRLFRVHMTVYAVGRPPSTPLEHAAAAVLACGDRAALSHRSALSLWGLLSDWRFPLHVTSPGQRRRPGIVIHRARGLVPTDIRKRHNIPVTSPARTLLDCAPELTRKRLSRLAADARRAGLLAPGSLADVAARFPYHPCRRRLLD